MGFACHDLSHAEITLIEYREGFVVCVFFYFLCVFCFRFFCRVGLLLLLLFLRFLFLFPFLFNDHFLLRFFLGGCFLCNNLDSGHGCGSSVVVDIVLGKDGLEW